MASACFKRDVLAIHSSDLHNNLREHIRHTKERPHQKLMTFHVTDLEHYWSTGFGHLKIMIVGLINCKETTRKAMTSQEMQQKVR